MILKTSLNKLSPFWNMFVFTLRKNLGFTAAGTVLALILSPFYVLNNISAFENGHRGFGLVYDFDETFLIISSILAMGACAFMIIMMYINMSYMFSKSASDFFHAVPLRRGELLISRFLASFVSAAVPLLAGYIGLVSIVLAKYSILNFTDIGVICTSFLFALFMMLVCGVFSIFFIVCAGSIFDSIICFAAINLGLPVIVLLLTEICGDSLFGYVADYEGMVKYVNPFLYSIFSHVSAVYGNRKFFELWPTILCMAFTVLMGAAAIWLYKKRKSESAGKAYAFNFVPLIIGFIISFICFYILGSIFSDSYKWVEFWISGAVGSLLSGVIYNVVTNRGFKKIKQGIIVGLISVAAVFFVNYGIELDIMGYGSYIPNQNNIKNAVVRFEGVDIAIQDMSVITELQREIINANGVKDFDDYYASYMRQDMSFKYTLKNGDVVERRYDVPKTVASKQRLALIHNELPSMHIRWIERFEGASFEVTKDGRTAILTFAEAHKLILAYAEDLKLTEYTSFTDLDERYNFFGTKIKDKADDEEYYISENYYHTFTCDETFVNFKAALEEIGFEQRAVDNNDKTEYKD